MKAAGRDLTAKQAPAGPALPRRSDRAPRRVPSIQTRTEEVFTMVLVKQNRLRVEPLEDRSVPSAAFVPEWNDLLVDVQRLRGQGNQQSARALAMMNAAMYDSVNAIDPTHAVYRVAATPPAGTSDDAAAAQAAHDVDFALYTQSAERSRIDGLLNTQMNQ